VVPGGFGTTPRQEVGAEVDVAERAHRCELDGPLEGVLGLVKAAEETEDRRQPRGNDLVVNVLKGKKLTNIRTHSKDEAVRLTPPIQMTLEKALAYITDDELVEITPKAIRLRKRLLDPHERKREERRKEAVLS